MKPADFIEEYGNEVIRATRGTSLYPSVKLAQMAIESGWGRSMPGNNAFGIKARGDYTPFWKGDSTSDNTREEVNGQSIYINEPFRAYNSVADSVRDHTVFLARYGRYRPVFAATSAQDQALALGRSGYATASGYGQSLIDLMDKYDLYQLDRRAKRQRMIRAVVVVVVVVAIVTVIVWKRKSIQKALKT